MMNISVRTQILIGIAAAVCVFLIGGAFALFQQIGPSPASLLPADRTIMLVSHLTPDVQQRIQRILPAVSDAPLREQGTPTAALIRSGSDLTWVTFDDRGRAHSDTPLMTESERALSADSAFRQLRQTYDARLPWLFVRFPETPLHIDGLTELSVPLSVTVGTGSVQIAWPTQMDSGFTGPVPQDQNGTVFRVSGSRLAVLLQSAASLLSDQNRLTARTLLTAWITRIAGTDVSATYDVLPLLNGPTTVSVTQSASGTKMALRSLPHNHDDASLARIEQGMTSAAAGMERVQRTFDETFEFDSMRVADGGEPEKTQIGAWSVQLSPAGMIGRMGREWAFGTDRALFTSLLQAMQSSAGQHIAEGVIDPAALTTMLDRWQIRLNLPWDLLPAGDAVKWTLDRKGGLAVLRISR